MGISEGIEVVIRSVKTDPVFVTAGVVGVSCLGSQVTLSLSQHYNPRKLRYSNISHCTPFRRFRRETRRKYLELFKQKALYKYCMMGIHHSVRGIVPPMGMLKYLGRDILVGV